MIHTVKGSSIVNEADVFLELPCFLYHPTTVGNLISGSSAFSKSSLNIWKFLVHVLLKPGSKDFERNHTYTSASVCVAIGEGGSALLGSGRPGLAAACSRPVLAGCWSPSQLPVSSLQRRQVCPHALKGRLWVSFSPLVSPAGVQASRGGSSSQHWYSGLRCSMYDSDRPLPRETPYPVIPPMSSVSPATAVGHSNLTPRGSLYSLAMQRCLLCG